MHMGVMATASYAIATRTMFSVFYKPWVNISAFLVPVRKYERAMVPTLSVGMRLKMKCDADDGSERSYSGTITGMGDVDSINWPNSNWRSVIVNWDEMGNERGTRVSPWEVEPCSSNPAAVISSPIARSKRYRPTPLAPASNPPLPGPNKSPFESSFTPKFSRVMQSPEAWSPGLGSFWRGSPNLSLELQRSQQLYGGSGARVLPLPSTRSTFRTPFTPLSDSEAKALPILPKVLPIGSVSGGTGTGNNKIPGSPWPTDNGLHSSWMIPKLSSQDGTCGTAVLPEKDLVTKISPQLNVNSVLPSPQGEMPQVPTVSLHVVPENSCKLFGVSLTDVRTMPVVAAAKIAPSVVVKEDGIQNPERKPPHQPYNHAIKDIESPRPSSKSDAASEQEKADLSVVSKEEDSHSQSHVRSCTKVIKKGSIVGRGIDLSKIDSYKKLIDELESMFHMEGELADPDKGWQVAYSDSEGDYMHVGDDPWLEFCMMVRKIYILSPEEVHNVGIPAAGGCGSKQQFKTM